MLSLALGIMKHNRFLQRLELEITTHTRTLKDSLHRLLRESMVHDTTRLQILADLMRHKIQDEEHAAGAQTLGQALRREGRVLEVMEAGAHACEVEVGELGVGEGLGVGVRGVDEVS